MAERDVDIITLRRARDGDDSAVKELAAQFDGVISGIAASYSIPGADSEDRFQIALIGFYDAVQKFDGSKNAGFARFARICINSRLIDACKEAARKKHQPLNTAVGYDDIPIVGSVDPEKALLVKEELLAVYAAIDVKLSDYEKQVLNLCIDGLSNREIALRMGKKVKSVSNAIDRIRKKLV